MRRAGAVGCALALALAAHAREPESFTHEADLHVERTGLVRLRLPIEVLRETQPDLSDLRIFDRTGTEVPYFVDAVPVSPQLVSRAVEVREVERQKSGPDEPARVHEEYRLEPRAAQAEPAARWALLLASSRPRFTRTAFVRVGLSEEGPPVESPLFRVDAGESLRIASGAGEPPVLRVRIEGTEDFYLEPTFRFEIELAGTSDPLVDEPLEILERVSKEGVTRIEVARRAGVVPVALRLEPARPDFVRLVEVFDLRPRQGPRTLGEARLYRVQTTHRAELLELPVTQARGDRLELRIHDQDSPPLDEIAIFARLRLPALVFALEPSGDAEPDGTLRFGGARLPRPAYDLADVSSVAGREVARALESLRQEAPTAHATGVRTLSPADAEPLLGFAMRAGEPLDTRAWARQRKVHVPAARDGVSGLALAPEDLAAARADLGDLRVVDAQGRQWPYVLEAAADARSWDVAVGPPEPDAGGVRHRLALPAEPIPVERIELDVDAPWFDRGFQLTARGADGARRPVASGRIERRVGDSRPARIELDGERIAALDLWIESGDDAPLPLRGARAEIRAPLLLLVAPAGEYRLLLDHPEAEAPRYELASMRERVVAARIEPASAQAQEKNPEHRAVARLGSPGLARRMLVWGSLVVAVLVLGALTLRTARREAGSDS